MRQGHALMDIRMKNLVNDLVMNQEKDLVKDLTKKLEYSLVKNLQ